MFMNVEFCYVSELFEWADIFRQLLFDQEFIICNLKSIFFFEWTSLFSIGQSNFLYIKKETRSYKIE